MPLERIIEQSRARVLIERMVCENRLPHALLFWGPSGVGKSAAALELARWLNCRKALQGPCGECPSCRQFRTLEHPHLTYLLPVPASALTDSEGGELSEKGSLQMAEILQAKGEDPYCTSVYPGGQTLLIGQIRGLLQWAAKRSFEDTPRLALIERADRLREEAANALLKLLEEPPPNFILVLTAQSQEDILPTLRSRCQSVEFERLTPAAIAEALRQRCRLSEEEIGRLARLSGGNLARALDLAARPEQAAELHELALNLVRHSLSRNPVEFDLLLESWAKREHSDQLLVLEIVSTWLRDAAFLQAAGASAQPRVVHQDHLELLQKFVANCPSADFVRAAESVNRAREHLEGNVLPPLALLLMSRDLYRAVYHKPAI